MRTSWPFGLGRAKRALLLHSRRRRRWHSRWLVAAALVFLFFVPAAALAGEPGAVGDLYVSEASGDRVLQFDGPTGALAGTFASGGGLDMPTGLAFGPNGNLFVVSNGTKEVIEYDGATGALIGTFASWDGLDFPMGLAFSRGGNLFVSSMNSDELVQFDGATGDFVQVISDGGLSGPRGLTIDPNGSLFVANHNGDEVLEYDGATGAFIGPFTYDAWLANPTDVTFGPNGSLFVSATDTGEVIEYDGTTGERLGTFAVTGPGGWIAGPYGVTFGPDGSLYVNTGWDEYSGILQFYGGTGTLVRTFAVDPPGRSAFSTFKRLAGPYPAPQLTDLTPASGEGCFPVEGLTISGTGLAWGAQLALTQTGEADLPGAIVGVRSDAQLTANFDLSEAAAGWCDLVLSYPDGQSATLVDAFEVLPCPPPVVTDFQPASADNCGMLAGAMITGEGFMPGTTVTLTQAGVPYVIVGTSVDVQSATTIVADFDLTGVALGFWDAVVTRPDGQTVTLVGALEVTCCPPGVAWILPSVACAGSEGSLHRIYGTGFVYPVTVKLSRAGEPDIEGTLVHPDCPCTVFIHALFNLTDAVAGTTWDVVITNPDGQSSTLTGALALNECGVGGDLYVPDERDADGFVVEFDAGTGQMVGNFVGGGRDFLGAWRLWGMAWGGPNGNLFVMARDLVAESTGAVFEFDRDTGAYLRRVWAYDPEALAFEPGLNGRLFIASESGTNVLVFDPGSDQPPEVFVSPGSGGLARPWDLTFGPNGNLFVISDNIYEPGAVAGVIEYDGQTGDFVRVFVDGSATEWGEPMTLVFHPTTGNLLVADIISYSVGVVRQYDGITGQALEPFVAPGSGGLGGWLRGLAFGPNGNLFVSDMGGNACVREYDRGTGEYVRTIGGSGELEEPHDLAFKPDLGPFPAPVLYSIYPLDPPADNCGWLTAQIDGADLVPGARVRLVMFGEPDVEGQLNGFDGDTGFEARFYLGGVAAGAWDLVLTYPDGQTATLPAGLYVGPCPGPTLDAVSVTQAENCGPIYGAVITGERLVEGTMLKLVKPGEPDVEGYVLPATPPAHCCGFASTTEVTVDLPVSGAALGLWDLTVTNPWGQSATLPAAVTISRCTLDYTLYDLYGRREGASGLAFDVNNAGMIITCVGDGARVVVWSNGVLTSIDPPEGYLSSRGVAISDDGALFGSVLWPPPLGDWPYVKHFPAMFADGQWTILEPPSLPLSYRHDLTGANDAGTLACGAVEWGYKYHVLHLIEEGGTLVELPYPPDLILDDYDFGQPRGVNNAGTVLRTYPGGAGTRTFLYQHPEGTFEEIVHPTGGSVTGRALNNAGVVVGGAVDFEAFGWFDGTMTSLGPGRALDVNDRGDAVGYAVWDFKIHALLYTRGEWIDLRELYLSPLTSGAFASGLPEAINDNGWIVGNVDASSGWLVPPRRCYPWLLVPNVKGDYDCDRHVDLDDFAVLADCMGGPDAPPAATPPTDPADCLTAFDFDEDGDLDLADFAAFQRALPRDGQPEPGACCYDDGSCSVEWPSMCYVLGDLYVGDGTTCATVDCSVTGACCFLSGECAEVWPLACAAASGTYFGDDTTCAAVTCDEPCADPFTCDFDEGEPWCNSPDMYNGGCNYDPEVFQPITCDQAVCGTAWAEDGWRDLDWYELVVTQTTQITWSAEAEFPLRLWIVDGTVGCPGTNLASASGEACDIVTVSSPVAAGTYWLIVAPQDFEGVPCDTGPWEYAATVTCGPVLGAYRNEIDPMTDVALAGAGLQLADDMTLEGTGARDLTYLDLRVYGNGGGDFDVTVELWTDCPGNGGTLIPDTTFTWPFIPDDGFVWTLVVDPLGPSVTIPDTVWMVATFSTPESGWIIAEDAEVGYTEDRYGRDDPWNCNADFGGDPYAGLWANLRCVEGQSRARREGEGPRLSITRVEPPLTIEAAR